MDDQEYNELQAEKDQLAERIRSVRAEREEVSGRIETLRGQQLAMSAVVEVFMAGGTVTQLDPLDIPLDEMPTSRLEAQIHLVAAPLRAKVIAEKVNAFPLEDKRAILRWLGVRVDVYRKSEPRPDGSRYKLSFAGSEAEPLLSSSA
jgi:hypothetical protein